MSGTYDVIVIGVGGMGASACFQIARRGAKVVGIEQLDIPHDFGSSGGESRLVRSAYFEHPDYVPLLRRSYEGFDALHQETGKEFFRRTGLVYLGPADGEVLSGTRLAAEEHHLELDEMTAAEWCREHPEFASPPEYSALFERDAGFVSPEQLIRTYAELSQQAGGEIRVRETVRSVSADGAGVLVKTDRASYRGGHVVFAAGAWSGRLLADLGLRLKVTRQSIGWFAPTDPTPFVPGRFPCFAIDDPSIDGIYYGFPITPYGRGGVKLGHHTPGEEVEPDAVDREIRWDEHDRLVAGMRRYVPGAVGSLLAWKTCLYTMSVDGHFIVDRHPRLPATIVAGFSGHGFKFTPVIGEIVADLALTGSSPLPIEFLRLERFTS